MDLIRRQSNISKPFSFLNSGVMLVSLMLVSLTTNVQKLQSHNWSGTYINHLIFYDYPGPDIMPVDDIFYLPELPKWI